MARKQYENLKVPTLDEVFAKYGKQANYYKVYKQYSIGLGMNHTQIDEAYVQKVRDYNMDIHPYTVN